MPAKKADRRLQRTRTLLQDALIDMIREKGYDATTVQDIIDRANVGRSTFYAHFADKETLFVSRLEDLRVFLRQQEAQAMRASGNPTERVFGFSLAMLEHAKGHWQLYQSMVGRRSGAVVLQRLHAMLADLVRDDLAAMGIKTVPTHRDLRVQYITGGFMGVLMWWLENAPTLSPNEVDALFRKLAMQGLAPDLETRR